MFVTPELNEVLIECSVVTVEVLHDFARNGAISLGGKMAPGTDRSDVPLRLDLSVAWAAYGLCSSCRPCLCAKKLQPSREEEHRARQDY